MNAKQFLKDQKVKTGKRKSDDLKLCVTAAAAAKIKTHHSNRLGKLTNEFSIILYKIYENRLKIGFFHQFVIAQNHQPTSCKWRFFSLSDFHYFSFECQCSRVQWYASDFYKRKSRKKELRSLQFHYCSNKQMPNQFHFLFRGILRLQCNAA